MLILVAKVITVVCEIIGSFFPTGKINTSLCTSCELKSMMQLQGWESFTDVSSNYNVRELPVFLS